LLLCAVKVPKGVVGSSMGSIAMAAGLWVVVVVVVGRSESQGQQVGLYVAMGSRTRDARCDATM